MSELNLEILKSIQTLRIALEQAISQGNALDQHDIERRLLTLYACLNVSELINQEESYYVQAA